MPASQHIKASVQFLAVLLGIQFPATVPRQAAGDSPRTWAPATHMANPDVLPASWLQPHPTVVAFAAIGEMSHQIAFSLFIALLFK